jgi:hypothetical protein
MTETTETTKTKTIPARWAWLYKACNGGSAWDMDAGYLSKLISELGIAESQVETLVAALKGLVEETVKEFGPSTYDCAMNKAREALRKVGR